MRIRWTQAAAADLEEIGDYLTINRPMLAQSIVGRLYEGAISLTSMPFRGREGVEPGTREWVVPGLPYIVIYRIKGEHVEILRIWHAARRRKGLGQ